MKRRQTKRKSKAKINGRPTKYNASYCTKVYRLTLLGATNEEIATLFDISVSTLHLWMNTYKRFSDAVARGKQHADANVADRLYQRAMGYTHKEDKIFQYEGSPVIVPTKRYYPPDTQAATFWLKNRRPQDWRDKQDIEHSGEITTKTVGPIPIVITTLEQQTKLNEDIQSDTDTDHA
jgi:hypothetical protein